MSKKDVNKESIKNKVVISMMIVFTMLICGVLLGYSYIKSKVYVSDKPSNNIQNSVNQTEGVKYKEVWGITNVLLIGADERDPIGGSRSDSMIIATLDNNNKKVKLTSLYRDTLVNIPGHGENKINAAFELGGAELLLQTIKETYDIAIDKYVIIDFKGFETVIDKVGGIEVEIKDYQIEELNKYIGEVTGGNDCPITEVGLQRVNGKQALSYARIRKNVGDDFERAERQREVLFKMAEKLKETKPTKYLGLMNSMLDYIDMNIEPIEALNMAYTIYKFPTLNTEQLSIPLQQYVVDDEVEGLGAVLLMDRHENTKVLHDFIFKDKLPVLEELEALEELD